MIINGIGSKYQCCTTRRRNLIRIFFGSVIEVLSFFSKMTSLWSLWRLNKISCEGITIQSQPPPPWVWSKSDVYFFRSALISTFMSVWCSGVRVKAKGVGWASLPAGKLRVIRNNLAFGTFYRILEKIRGNTNFPVFCSYF